MVLAGPPLACWLKATVEEPCGATVGQEAFVADPELEAGASGRAVEPQTEEKGHAQDPDLHKFGN